MKAKELRELTVDELKRKAETLRRELFSARIARVKQQLKNPLKLRDLKREIARALTIIREKEK